MYVHALHTVHALPDLRVAGGRLGDGVSETVDRQAPLLCGGKSMANHVTAKRIQLLRRGGPSEFQT